jgi:hypothetical protein
VVSGVCLLLARVRLTRLRPHLFAEHVRACEIRACCSAAARTQWANTPLLTATRELKDIRKLTFGFSPLQRQWMRLLSENVRFIGMVKVGLPFPA